MYRSRLCFVAVAEDGKGLSCDSGKEGSRCSWDFVSGFRVRDGFAAAVDLFLQG